MRLLSFLTGLAGLLAAGALAAQTPAANPSTPPPPPPLSPENSWHLDLSTGGRVTIQLRPDAAPTHVERIKTLTRRRFYDGLTFHRVVEGFMAQGGDPTGTGAGESDLPDLAIEISGLPHLRGAVAMARGEELNSANSQFYIMFVPRLGMDDNYSVFGRVVGGMNFVDSIERGEPPANPTRIVRASIGSDNVPPMSAEALRAAGAQANAATQAATPAQGQPGADGLTLPGASAPATTPPATPPGSPPASAADPASQPAAPEPAQAAEPSRENPPTAEPEDAAPTPELAPPPD